MWILARRARTDQIEHRLRAMSAAMAAERELPHVPPLATLFLNRNTGGIHLRAARLSARVPLRPLVEPFG